MIFSKRCLPDVPELYINGAVVEEIHNVNFMRSVAGQKWGSHPSALLKSCVRSIIDYGIFFGDLIQLDRIRWNCLRIISINRHSLTTQSDKKKMTSKPEVGIM